ncbi:MAG: choice-of-anchor V domain-containing protein [Candidatus Poseidoniaceae archaeon]
MRATVAVIVLALLAQVAVSAPSGIGSAANEGCLCHGEKNTNTNVELHGLPKSFESNTSYNFSIVVTSQTIPQNTNGESGGFRLLVTGGSIFFNETEGLIQVLDDGWTHTELGNTVRMWNFSLMSPADNSSYVDLTVYGNAVNGNQASTGDEWNSLDLRLPGTQYEGEMLGEKTDEFNPLDYTVGMVSMLVLVGLLIITIRD